MSNDPNLDDLVSEKLPTNVIRAIDKVEVVSVELKTDENSLDRESRLRREEADADSLRRREEVNAAFQRRKEVALYIFAVFAIFSIGAFCLSVLISVNSSPDDKKWASSVLSAMVSGLLGYIVGSRSNK